MMKMQKSLHGEGFFVFTFSVKVQSLRVLT